MKKGSGRKWLVVINCFLLQIKLIDCGHCLETRNKRKAGIGVMGHEIEARDKHGGRNFGYCTGSLVLGGETFLSTCLGMGRHIYLWYLSDILIFF